MFQSTGTSLFFALLLFFNSCSDEPRAIPPLDKSLDGKYQLVSMKFIEPADLDLDGVSSTDVLQEAHLTQEKDTYYGVYESRLQKSTGGEDYQMFSQRLPLTVVESDSQTGQFEGVRYALTNALYKCYFRIGDDNIHIAEDVLIADYATGYSLRISGTNRLKAIHKQHFYVNGWVLLEIESEFKKID